MKPEFADNRELTMLDALNGHLRWLRQTRREPVELSIATGYFNPQGFALLADELGKGLKLITRITSQKTQNPASLRH